MFKKDPQPKASANIKSSEKGKVKTIDQYLQYIQYSSTRNYQRM